MQSAIQSARVPVTVLARGLIRSSDAPELHPGTLCFPLYAYRGRALCGDTNVILYIVTEYTIDINGKTIAPSFRAWDDASAVLADIGPILVRFCVVHIILEANTTLYKDRDRTVSSFWESDVCFKDAAPGRRDKVRDMLCKGIVKFCVPVWFELVLFCIATELIKRPSLIEMKVLRSECAVETASNVGCLIAMVLLAM